MVLPQGGHFHRATDVGVQATQVGISHFVSRLEQGSDHLPMDTCIAIEVPPIALYIIQAEHQQFLNHLLQGVLPRMCQMFVNEVKRWPRYVSRLVNSQLSWVIGRSIEMKQLSCAWD